MSAIASMSGFLVAMLVNDTGLAVAILIALAVSAIIGFVNGIGAGVIRVHPLIMTLGMSLVVPGLANWWQLKRVQTGSGVPDEFRKLGAKLLADVIPVSLFLLIPLAILVILLLNRTGFGRLLYAIGDNPIAARLSGAKSWQVLNRSLRDLGCARRHRRVPLVRSHQRGQRHARRYRAAPLRCRRRNRWDLDPRRQR